MQVLCRPLILLPMVTVTVRRHKGENNNSYKFVGLYPYIMIIN